MKINSDIMGKIITGLVAGGIGGGFFWMVGKAIDAERERAAALAEYRKDTVGSKDILGDIDRVSLENELLGEENQVHAKALLMADKAELDRAGSIQAINDALGKLYSHIQEFGSKSGNSHVNYAWSKYEREVRRAKEEAERREARMREEERWRRLEESVQSFAKVLGGSSN